MPADPAQPDPADEFGPEEFAAATNVSRETIEHFELYAELLREWNAIHNLVSKNSLPHIWRRHLLDSAQLARFVPADARSLVDLGSGAGFPGLVLAILGVEGVELIESDGRKCAFLAEASRVSGAPVTIHNQRIEALPPSPADAITARACAPLARLLHYAQPLWAPQTCMIALKGAHIDKELTEATKCWIMDVERYPSLTDHEAVVLCIRHLQYDKNSDQDGA